MRHLYYMQGTRKALKKHFPEDVLQAVDVALQSEAEGAEGTRGVSVMHGFGRGAQVRAFKLPHRGDAYRVVYTLQFDGWLCVLHCFKKKSKRGDETPRQDLDVIAQRLHQAESQHRQWRRET